MTLQEMRREMEKLKRGQEIHHHHQNDQRTDKMKGKMHEEYNPGQLPTQPFINPQNLSV